MSARTGTQSHGQRRKLEARLDEALAQTFPASDPFSVGQFTGTEPPARPIDRKAPKLSAQHTAPSRRKSTGN